MTVESRASIRSETEFGLHAEDVLPCRERWPYRKNCRQRATGSRLRTRAGPVRRAGRVQIPSTNPPDKSAVPARATPRRCLPSLHWKPRSNFPAARPPHFRERTERARSETSSRRWVRVSLPASRILSQDCGRSREAHACHRTPTTPGGRHRQDGALHNGAVSPGYRHAFLRQPRISLRSR